MSGSIHTVPVAQIDAASHGGPSYFCPTVVELVDRL